ncbi:hypothetical protein [Streptomyces sp. NBC_01373]|uniref:hypothetical protein n=1 Tax=Streptomyces sp. NBC_01373 TaxID=2903843 RepID=UPI00224F3C3F|nr:hypothetical protein [Streptomyces sp. NBC_01373]MCX4697030.1 hypothetical protein [Streptomyces sp. NBC_01373]MCX4707045.1 hypothetical protein [Streptomyces sp. NBC_01373]
MTFLWTATELPGHAYDPEPDDDNDDTPHCRAPRDLWGQGITAHAANTATVITPPARYL